MGNGFNELMCPEPVGLFNYFKNFTGTQELRVEMVLLGLPIVPWRAEFCSKSLTTLVTC